jgi:ribosomal protein S18 acetylase RimI-like enzyme
MKYVLNDSSLKAEAFLALANSVWPGSYDPEKTREALGRTFNITAYQEGRLAGCLRILSDGYYFGTITELLVLPEFQRQGVGSHLLELAKANAPTMLYFGAQPEAQGFYEKNGCEKGLQSYVIPKAGQ